MKKNKTMVVPRLHDELKSIDADIERLEERRLRVIGLLETYEKVPVTARTPNIFTLALHRATGSPASGEGLSAQSIAVKVLGRSQKEMLPSDIRDTARQLGMNPPHSLPQMLWKKAEKGITFYNNDGKYGLLAWKDQN